MLSVQSAAAPRPDLPPLSPRKPSEEPAAVSAKPPVVPPSPRPAGVAEGLDQWFEDLQKYETTLGAMATASADPKFREELGTIEQWYKLLSESEQTATLYTLLQNANPAQVKFMSAVLHQMSAEVQQQQPAAADATKPKARTLRPPSLNLPLPGSPATAHFTTPATGSLAPDAARIIGSKTEQGPSGQDVVVNNNWASEVNTPLVRMFPAGGEVQQKLPNQGVVPGLTPGVGIPMLNPFNMAMLNNMGFSNEAQLLAVQMVMSGLVQPPPVPGQKPQQKPKLNTGNNWRAPGSGKYPGSALRTGGFKSSGLKSSGLRSSGLRSATTPLASAGATPKESEDIDPELIKDVPAWMKSLRLHKYNSCFEGMTWEDMVLLDDAALEAKGIAALGARRRLTKTFELVKKKMGMETTPTVGDYVLASAALPGKNSMLSQELTDDDFIVPHSAAPKFSSTQ